MIDVGSFFEEARNLVDSELDRLVPEPGREPARLYEAIRWSLFGNGKRFRPALVFATGRIFGAPETKLVSAAAAVEMIHTYSLIHDDLPAMDDDDMRRGRETCHKRFGDATAILAGDALQALAFQVISEDKSLSVNTRLALVSGLANAAAAMVYGQEQDLAAEGIELSLQEIDRMHSAKTGSLIRFSVTAGAVIAGADKSELSAISNYGLGLGLLFQITDDLLDITQTSKTLGKTAGKDAHARKATYPAALGEKETRRLAKRIYGEVVGELEKINRPNGLLTEIAEFILIRES